MPNSSFYRLFGKRTTETQLSGTSQDTQTHEEIYAAQRYSQFFGLNALEIATIAHAKRFLSQRVVQKVVDGIWKGEIVFWDSLTVNSTKKPHIFNRRLDRTNNRLTGILTISFHQNGRSILTPESTSVPENL